ncbi:hypothetical protein [Desulfobotulus sp.]|jgi:mono/diheme cytochrome c family protein|uniref:hypothetical protein n=1 Tax=Desulfobotulus sp. TaxID=1940337 RepID=UPI002A361325|nr:hypothetical protein [Desulfobotulus sp.]MDY0162862.1 hypothetical protein [Desulfobotulus sp.]
MLRKNVLTFALPALGSALLLLSMGPASASPTVDATPAEGLAILENRCAVCHGVDKVTRTQKDKRQWERTVNRMMGKGATLTEAEKILLIDYLATHHGR